MMGEWEVEIREEGRERNSAGRKVKIGDNHGRS